MFVPYLFIHSEGETNIFWNCYINRFHCQVSDNSSVSNGQRASLLLPVMIGGLACRDVGYGGPALKPKGLGSCLFSPDSSEMTDFISLMYAGLLQSLVCLNPIPFLLSTSSSYLDLPPSNQLGCAHNMEEKNLISRLISQQVFHIPNRVWTESDVWTVHMFTDTKVTWMSLPFVTCVVFSAISSCLTICACTLFSQWLRIVSVCSLWDNNFINGGSHVNNLIGGQSIFLIAKAFIRTFIWSSCNSENVNGRYYAIMVMGITLTHKFALTLQHFPHSTQKQTRRRQIVAGSECDASIIQPLKLWIINR